MGFTCGSFDLLHAGHVLMLEQCKHNCDFLMVGLQTDPTIDRTEKQKPIQTVYERFIQLRAVKHVDEIVVYETENDLVNILLSVMPDIRFLGEDHETKDYTGKGIKGVQIKFNTRQNGYSSTSLRERCGIAYSDSNVISIDAEIERNEEMAPLTPTT